MIVFVLVVTFFSCNTKEETSLVIEGKISNGSAKTLYLEENNPEGTAPVIIDSANVNNGLFRFETTTQQEGLLSLRADQNNYPFVQFINDTKKITIDADLANAKDPYTLSGSPASQELLLFRKKMNEQVMIMSTLVSQYEQLGTLKASDSLPQNKIDTLKNSMLRNYQSAAEAMKNYTVTVIDKSNNAALSLFVLGALQKMFEQFGVQAFNKTEMVSVVDKMSAKFPNHAAINNLKKNTPSAKAIDFSLPDTTGQPLSLFSFKGKYVLVDFWASWCKPCRQENPNVVAAFQQFSQKNFTILGVSLDQNREQWVQAIQNDGLTWNHVSDLKYWNSEAATLYNVHSIPYNFLVDPDGNIIAEDIRGEALHQTLAKFLK